MPRVFKHIEIMFKRTVVQTQAVTVAVPPELTPELQQTMARQLAEARLKEPKWENGTVTKAEIADTPRVKVVA
jgi:hypothetical protein